MTAPKRKILVSACLLGEEVRWNGEGAREVGATLERWRVEGRLVMVCPEVAGGLPVPRPPAELAADRRVVTREGDDVTAEFNAGAEYALRLARRHEVAFAILKARSPSCGSEQVYDGSFEGRLTAGEGTTTRLLREAGFDVFSEERLEEADRRLAELEGPDSPRSPDAPDAPGAPDAEF